MESVSANFRSCIFTLWSWSSDIKLHLDSWVFLNLLWSIFKFIVIKWWQTLTKKWTNVWETLNYLSAIGRPIVFKCEQRIISIQHLLLGKDLIAILLTRFGKSMIFTVYALAKVSWELLCSPWQKNTKQLLNWHLLRHCKPAKIIINYSRSDWFSKANTLVWAKLCARWAELKMLSFWAGGISSFPPCAREYRLLRRLELYEQRRMIICLLLAWQNCIPQRKTFQSLYPALPEDNSWCQHNILSLNWNLVLFSLVLLL